MSGRATGDRQLLGWLARELDAVPPPERAVREAIHAASSVRQRGRPRGWFRRLVEHARPGRHGEVAGAGPEVTLQPDAFDAGAHAGAPMASATAGSMVLPATLSAGAFAVLLGIFLVLMGLGSGSSLPRMIGGGMPSSADSALVLDDPAVGHRTIIVAEDGSGHFRTIAAAIAAWVPGDDCIDVRPGTYRESLIVAADICLRGQGDRAQVVLEPSDPAVEPPGRPSWWWGTPDFPAGWRFVLYLSDSDARISGLTIRGAEVGTAVIVDGGSPTLDDLAIDPAGDMVDRSPSDPREALIIGRGSSAIVTRSLMTAVVGVADGSQPTLADDRIVGGCLMVDQSGTSPHVTGNHFEASGCWDFSLRVMGGAGGTYESNVIISDPQSDGIRVAGEGTDPTIQGNIVTGGVSGIWIGSGSQALVERNIVTQAERGIVVYGADPVIDGNEIHDNGTGISVEGGEPELSRNTVCGNELDLSLPDGARASWAGNLVGTGCPEDGQSAQP